MLSHLSAYRYLSAPVPVSAQARLLISPAERFEVVVNFSGFEGRTLMLHNNAPTPYSAADSEDAVPLPDLMLFVVAAAVPVVPAGSSGVASFVVGLGALLGARLFLAFAGLPAGRAGGKGGSGDTAAVAAAAPTLEARETSIFSSPLTRMPVQGGSIPRGGGSSAAAAAAAGSSSGGYGTIQVAGTALLLVCSVLVLVAATPFGSRDEQSGGGAGRSDGVMTSDTVAAAAAAERRSRELPTAGHYAAASGPTPSFILPPTLVPVPRLVPDALALQSDPAALTVAGYAYRRIDSEYNC